MIKLANFQNLINRLLVTEVRHLLTNDLNQTMVKKMTNFSKKLGKIAENTPAYLDALATKNSDTTASALVGPYALM